MTWFLSWVALSLGPPSHFQTCCRSFGQSQSGKKWFWSEGSRQKRSVGKVGLILARCCAIFLCWATNYDSPTPRLDIQKKHDFKVILHCRQDLFSYFRAKVTNSNKVIKSDPPFWAPYKDKESFLNLVQFFHRSLWIWENLGPGYQILDLDPK